MLNSKKDFIDCLKKIINPLKDFYTPKKAGIKLGHFSASYPDEIANMEGFARILWGLAPLWCHTDECEDFADIYRKGIAAGSDPENVEYWGEMYEDGNDQRIVEMAALGLMLVLAPHKIWDPLSDKEKDNFHKWLLLVNDRENKGLVCDNNWQFFPVLVNLGLKNVGVSYDSARIKESIERYHSYYRGNGWYHDGNTDQADYYISFAIHFYSLIYAKVMEKEDPENSKIFKERAKEFAKSFIYQFDENGSALAFGRSLTYRFAQVAFWSACVYADVYPFELGVIKGIIERNLEWWLSKPIFDNAGILTVGYAYPNLYMSEFYNAYGSPYWSLKTFLILALDENHEFFKVKSLPLPKSDSICVIPEACMTIQRIGGYPVALTSGQWAAWLPTHCAEKYSKFAYSSRYAFSVARTTDALSESAPDSTLAFEIDGRIFHRRKCAEYKINEDGSIYSKWSPFMGIEVETTLIPTSDGHIRRHTVNSTYDCVVYDTTFATPRGSDRGEIYGGGESITLYPDPNTSLLYSKSEIKAIKYEIKKGFSEIETKVVYPKE